MTETVRFATIGTSAIARRFLDALGQLDGVSYAAAYSRDLARARGFAAEFGATFAFDSLAELATSDEVDAVYVASPNALHAAQALELVAGGKHVLAEKSFASNAAEAGRVFEAAEAAGVVAMEAMRNIHTPGFAAIEASLARIGEVAEATLRFSKVTSRIERLRAGEHVNLFDPLLSGGALMDIGVYVVEPAVALFGRPSRVLAAANVVDVPWEGADPAHARIDLAGNALLGYDGPGGSFNVTLAYGKVYDDLVDSEIAGTEATLLFPQASAPSEIRLVPHVDKGMVYNVKSGAGEAVECDYAAYGLDGPVENDMLYEIADFAGAVRGEADGLRRVERFRQVTCDSLVVMDEIRRQVGVRVPADD